MGSLFNAAIKTVALYGHQAKGIAPTVMRSYRANLTQTIGLYKKGGCTTTTIALHLGTKKDPWYVVVMETIDTWLDLAPQLAMQNLALDITWQKARQRLLHPFTRWRRVVGPIHNLIAVLLHLGWDPVQPWEWKGPEGTTWKLDPRSHLLKHQIREQVLKHFELLLWKQASTHLHGKGMELGADISGGKKHVKYLKGHGRYGEAGMLATIIKAGIWTPERVAAGRRPPCPTPNCPKCHKIGGATWAHQVWECPWTIAQTDPRIQATNQHLNLGLEGSEVLPCLWLRGIVPHSWTIGRVLEYTQQHEDCQIQLGGAFLAGRLNLPEGATAGTDGSGGQMSSDPRCRKVGWGVIVLDQDLNPIAWASGGAKGDQTVPRAELSALCWLAQHTDGDIEVAIDAKYVIRGFRKGPMGIHEYHLDLWEQLWAHMQARQGTISTTWIKSHLSIDSAYNLEFPAWAYAANQIADVLADEAAVRVALPLAIVALVEWADSRAWQIRQRLLATAMLWALEDNIQLDPSQHITPLTKQEVIQELKLISKHHIIEKATCLWCCHCNTNVSILKPVCDIIHWMVHSKCIEPNHLPKQTLEVEGIHPSHSMDCYKGVHYCTKCGNWKVHRSINLHKICPPIRDRTNHGKNTLKALGNGKIPPGINQWPWAI